MSKKTIIIFGKGNSQYNCKLPVWPLIFHSYNHRTYKQKNPLSQRLKRTQTGGLFKWSHSSCLRLKITPVLKARHRGEGPGPRAGVGLCNSLVLGSGIEFKIPRPFTSQDVLGTLWTCPVDHSTRLGTVLTLQCTNQAWDRVGYVQKSKHVRARRPFEET